MGLRIRGRKFKPAPWDWQRARVAPDCLWALRGLRIAWPMWQGHGADNASAAMVTIYDPIRRIAALSSTGKVLAIGGPRGRVQRSTVAASFDPVIYLSAIETALLPTQGATVVLHYRKTDSTNRLSGAFGIKGEGVGESAKRFGAHLPYSDGTVYWDFGGFTDGVTRVTAAGLTFGDDVWVFTTGPRGMEIWQNGVRRGSNGANPTRAGGAGDQFALFHHGLTTVATSDLAESGGLLLYNRQLSFSEIAALSIDPWIPFRPATRRAAKKPQTIVAVGQVEETDLAQPITRQKRRTLGIASETDLAQTIFRPHIRYRQFESVLNGAPGDSFGVSFDAAVLVGDLLVADVVSNPGNPVVSVTESPSGRAFHLIDAIESSGQRLEKWYLQNALGGMPTTVVVQLTTVAPAFQSGLTITDYRKVRRTSPLLTSQKATAGGTHVDAGGLTPSENNALVHSSYSDAGNHAATPVAPYKERTIGTIFVPEVVDNIQGPVAEAVGAIADLSGSDEWVAITAVFAEDLGHVPLDPASETDLAQPITRAHRRTLGQASETDSAQDITRATHSVVVGQVSETDTAQSITHQKRVALGQPAETDTAQPVTGARRHAIGQPSETDTAQPVTARKVHAIGQPAETDVAQPVTAVRARTLGQAIEADLAQAISSRKQCALGLVSETDLAQPVAATKRRTLAQPAETDLAQIISHAKRPTLGFPVETDLAQPIQASQPGQLGMASETDLAQSIMLRHVVAVGQASESETAQGISHQKRRAIGQAVETDSAQTIRPAHARTLGEASEVDAAQAISSRKVHALNYASETDLAQPLTRGGRFLNPAAELDAALGIQHAKRRTLGLALELDFAQGITPLHARVVGIASEMDEARPMRRQKRKTLGFVTESDIARSVVPASVYGLNFASETDQAFAFAHARHRTLGLAVELDEAFALTSSGGAPVTRLVRGRMATFTIPGQRQATLTTPGMRRADFLDAG